MQDIIGVWRLVECRTTDDSGAPVAEHEYGPEPMGVVIFGPVRMMATVGDGRTELPPGIERFTAAYCGPWRFDGSTLVTTVDATSRPERLGTEQVRKVRFEGARMVLAPPPRRFNGVMQHFELVWEKLA